MCTEFNLKIDDSTELLDTKTFDDYDTNELLLLSDTIKQSCFEFLFNSRIEIGRASCRERVCARV